MNDLGSTLVIRQHVNAEFRQLHIDRNALLYVRAGVKVLRDAALNEMQVETGELVYLRRGDVLYVRNIPAPDRPYLAEGLAFAPELIEGHCRDLPHTKGGRALSPQRPEARPGLLAAMRVAQTALEDAALPCAVRRIRFREVLAWLDSLNVEHREAGEDSVAQRLRRLVLTDTSHPWQAAAVAAEFGYSEASLRRALAREGTKFSAVLADVRLTQALAMIQSGTDRLTNIAIDCGYASPSHFSESFRKRFGISPGSLRKMSK